MRLHAVFRNQFKAQRNRLVRKIELVHLSFLSKKFMLSLDGKVSAKIQEPSFWQICKF